MIDNGDAFCATEGADIPLPEFLDQRDRNEPITVDEAVKILELVQRSINMILDAVLAERECESP